MSEKRKKSSETGTVRCPFCDDSDALEELLALPVISSVPGSRTDDLLNARITDFFIHTENEMCSLDTGLIENGTEVWICGRVSNICQESIVQPTVKMIGPITEWWFSGFDGSPNLLIGVESPYAGYLLSHLPHQSYREIFEKLNCKMFLTKFVIEALQDEPECDFDRLLSIVQQRKSEFFETTISASYLLSVADFIVNQIESYDSCRDPEERSLADTAIVKILKETAGKSNAVLKNFGLEPIGDAQCQTRILSGVNTAKANAVFDRILANIISNLIPSPIEYSSIFEIEPGLMIVFQVDGKQNFGRIIRQDAQRIHLNIFCLGTETFLAETIGKKILFSTNKCRDIEYDSVLGQVKTKSSMSLLENFDDNAYQVFYQLQYQEDNCSFETVSENLLTCPGCSMNKPKTFNVGDCVLFTTTEPIISCFDYFTDNETDPERYDQDEYPERYRKKPSDQIRDRYQTEDLARCQYVGFVREIDQKSNRLKINIFYRPQHVFVRYEDFISADLNIVFWTENEIEIPMVDVSRKCEVILSDSNPSYSPLKDDIFFYFDRCYDSENGKFYPVPEHLKPWFSSKKPDRKEFGEKIRILDLFAGCGGLSFGFAPITSKLHAIEKDKSAAESYKKNYPDSVVYNSDANLLLKMMIDRREKFLTDSFPGEIDLIIGGPPCQGFSEMNRFSLNQYSLFKRSSVGCYLNYLEFYRPRIFLFENVDNFIRFGQSLIFKLFCSFVVHLGYQIRVAVLQAGCYGLPQNRRRLFIVGAKFGTPLPQFPRATHAFSEKKSKTSFKIDGRKFDPIPMEPGILRMITIEDAIGDLPELTENDFYLEQERSYRLEPPGHYQKILRNDNGYVRDHHCRIVSDLNIERIKRIPFWPGADWRDLPNIKILLRNGTMTETLDYREDGSRKKRKRKLSEPKQDCQTLIPWCLAHSADRNNHWPGLYGRLAWRGYFPTVVTNPDPITAQGKVIHPAQHRVISVREMARSQGFPDSFEFFGTTNEKFSQIGNAVPPLMSTALAGEIQKSMDHQMTP